MTRQETFDRRAGARRTHRRSQKSGYTPLRILVVTILFIGIGLLFSRFITAVSAKSLQAGDSSVDSITGLRSENSLHVPSGTGTESWALVLVNADNPLPDGFEADVTEVDLNGYYFDSRAASALEEMMQAARNEGLEPWICSAYRSVATQNELFDEQVSGYVMQGMSQEDAQEAAATEVAVPGTSEHNLGLAVDIVDRSYQLLDDAQGDTAVSKWLHENCHRYGFILRYAEDKQSLTGVIYEPWHYRYVGVEAATAIKEQGVCLEEYLAG